MHKRNLIILVLCQLISATGSIVFVTLGGIIGASLAGNPAWATLPLSTLIIATATATIPATMLMRAIGRGPGFALASTSALAAVLLAARALTAESFPLFLLASFGFGINLAFTQQYRYAAAESVAARYVPRAISFVLLGAIGGAMLGPELAKRGLPWASEVPYVGTMIALAALYAIQATLFLFLERTVVDAGPGPASPARSLLSIARQPVFLVAVLAGTAGYGLMTLIMTATPLSMHINDGYTLAATADVIRAHVVGMYLPSLVSGVLIEKLGVVRLMLAGAVTLIGTSVAGLAGHTVLHYWWALVLLGVGWNFLYVGGTTMLTYTYSTGERFRAQGINEFLVFGTAATASLLAGTVMHYLGWRWLMLIPLPVLALLCVALAWIRNAEQVLGRRVPVRAGEFS